MKYYQFIEPCNRNGKPFVPGDKITSESFSVDPDSLEKLILGKVLKEIKAPKSKKVQQQVEIASETPASKLPNLQDMNVSEAADVIEDIMNTETLFRLSEQEKKGSDRKTVHRAIDRQVRLYG